MCKKVGKCNLEKTYDESCNHENYYHEILKTYINQFDNMKWKKKKKSIDKSNKNIYSNNEGVQGKRRRK